MSAERTLEAIGAFERDLVVQAGAGTGKTHALVTLYLHLVTGLSARRAPLSPSRILIITFTDKAAAELRDRVRGRLTRLIVEGLAAEPVLGDAAARLGRTLPPADVLRRTLAELPRAPIGTFHGFGHSLLRRHAGAAGLDPAFQPLDEIEAQLRMSEAARDAVLEGLEARLPEVERLVETYGFHPRGRGGVVEAIARVRALRAEEGRGAEGLAEAYADLPLAAARRDADARLRAALRDLSPFAEAAGEKSRPRIREAVQAARAPELDTDGAARFVAELLKSLSRVRGLSGESKEAFDEAKAAVATAAEARADAEAAIAVAPMAVAFERLVDACERRYGDWKRAARVVDFADLIRMPRDLLRDRPDIARAEGARHVAILVDEFQDTNRVQADLVERLAAAAPVEEGVGRRFVVGDRKQSIYEFRGADVGVFTEVTGALRAAGAGEVVLRRSFRSAPRVVELCNALFESAFGQHARPEPWALRFDPTRDALQASRTDPPDAGAELLILPPLEGADAVARRRQEAAAIARRMQALVAAGRRPGEMALLLRRYTSLEVYREALRRAGLPHYVVRGRGFYEAQEIRDMAQLVALLGDLDDRLALVAVLRSPLCGLSDEGLAALAISGELGRVALLGPVRAALGAGDRAALDDFVGRLATLRRSMDRLGPADLLREVLDVFDLRAIWAATEDGTQRIANLEHLLARAEQMSSDARRATADRAGFARWLARAVRPADAIAAADAQVLDERDDVVRVMTIHQAKGLEFPVVFVADCGAEPWTLSSTITYDADLGLGLKAPGEPGSFVHTTPSRRVAAQRAARQQAESLRLFYVAATRARDRVVFSGEAARRGGWRAHLDALVAAPSTRALIQIGPEQDRAPVVAPPERGRPLDVDGLAALRPFVPRSARALSVAVTQLADYTLCPRRYHLLHELGLEEHPRVDRAIDSPLLVDRAMNDDPLRIGTLAHRLLERAPFGLSPEEARPALVQQLLQEGHAVEDPIVNEVLDHVLAFLGTAYARGLKGQPLRQELPFVLALPSSASRARILRGQIDLLAFSPQQGPERGIDVVDYKHARRGDPEVYRFQLEAYALAAASLYPRAPRIRVGLAYLRDPDPSPVWVEVGPLDAIAERIGRSFDALVRARLESTRPGVERSRCEQMHCGYVSWCHA